VKPTVATLSGAGREYVPQGGHVWLDAPQHGGVVEPAGHRRDHAHPGPGPLQDVPHLAMPQDGQDGVGDGADAGAGQVQGGELPPVGQLAGDDVAGLHAELEQSGGHLVHDGRQLAEGVLLAWPVDVVADHGDLVRLPPGVLGEVVEQRAVPPPALPVVFGREAGDVVFGHGGFPY
jgi:hypothetical protein